MEKKINVTIVGIGLIGASLGMALLRSGKYHVMGVVRRREAIEEAIQLKAIHEGTVDMQEGVKNADIIVVATPVGSIAPITRQILQLKQDPVIITDVGSVKANIIKEITPYLAAGQYFLGGHPMAGGEKQGMSAADPFLLQNAVYCLTPTADTPEFVLERVKEMVLVTGAHILELEPEIHDHFVAGVSHLPHLVAAILVNTVADLEAKKPGLLNLAAGGFRDTTRIASGDPLLWRDIFLSNQDQVIQVLKSFMQQTAELLTILENADDKGLVDKLTNAARVRQQIPQRSKGFLAPLSEIVVVVQDRPGAIHEVLTWLAQAQINIKDIEILRVREGEGGTLRLALENDQAMENSTKILREKGFTVYQRK